MTSALQAANDTLNLKKAGYTNEQLAAQQAQVNSAKANVESQRAQIKYAEANVNNIAAQLAKNSVR